MRPQAIHRIREARRQQRTRQRILMGAIALALWAYAGTQAIFVRFEDGSSVLFVGPVGISLHVGR